MKFKLGLLALATILALSLLPSKVERVDALGQQVVSMAFEDSRLYVSTAEGDVYWQQIEPNGSFHPTDPPHYVGNIFHGATSVESTSWGTLKQRFK